MTDPRPETLDREALRIAEKVLERHPASRAYHERMYGPQVGEPDEVILSRALLAAEQRVEEAERERDEAFAKRDHVGKLAADYALAQAKAEDRERVLRDALKRIMDTPHYENRGGVCPPCMAEVALRRDLDESALRDDGNLGPLSHRGKVAPHKAAEEEK